MSVSMVMDYDIEASLLLFRRLLKKDGIFKELVLRKFAMTRTQKRKVKNGIAERRVRRAEMRRRSYEARSTR